LHTANSFTTSNLVACIQKQEPEVGLASAQALAHSQLEMAIVLPFLTNHAGDTNSVIRMNVATCIGAYGSKAASALPILLELLKDPSRDVRDSATNAVYVIDPTLLPPGTIPSRPFIE
jgi:HEAT repeat protein